MELIDEERAILDGAEGPARQKAMNLLVRYGDALGAERLVDTNNVCGGVPGGLPFVRNLAPDLPSIDAFFSKLELDSDETLEIPQMKAFACRLAHALDPECWEMQGVSREVYECNQEIERFCARVGIQMLDTCAPYEVGNVPVRGEHCAWMESSAVVYCNSVLGARTNTEGLSSTGAAMLVGKIPYWGYHLDKNRLGTHLVNVKVELKKEMDWGLLGYCVGEVVQEQVPVFNGVQGNPNKPFLKHLGAAAACGGGVELYHILGVTPEARSLEEVFGPRKPVTVIDYGERERREAYENLNSATEPDVDFVTLGCPHYSVEQLSYACRLLEGKRVHENTNLWIFVPRSVKEIANRQGYADTIRRAGAVLMSDTCPAVGHVYPKGVRVAAADSAKQAHYLPSALGLPTWFGSVEDCVDAAVSGRWTGGLV